MSIYDEETQARIRLMAAAPDLLAVLHEIIDIKDNGGGLVLARIEAAARAAIAKAEGAS